MLAIPNRRMTMPQLPKTPDAPPPMQRDGALNPGASSPFETKPVRSLPSAPNVPPPSPESLRDRSGGKR